MDFAIDFDHTCCISDSKDLKLEKNVPHAIESLKTLVEQGHRLILNTCRGTGTQEVAEAWFSHYDIPLFGSQSNPEQLEWTDSPKVYAHYYIDDKGLGTPLIEPEDDKPYVDWLRVMEFLKERGIII